MHIERVRVRQEGMRTVRVCREVFVEVPLNIAQDRQLLHDWMAGQRIRQYWEPIGTPCVVEETWALAHGGEAMYPPKESERGQVSR